MQLRLLPIAIFAAVLLLGLKIGDLWSGVGDAGIARLHAQQADAVPGAAASAAAPDAASAPAPAESPASPPAQAAGLPDDPALLTQAEIDLLQKLGERRKELEKWTRDLDMREQLLKATENRVAAKVAELRTIQEKVKAMLGTYEEAQETKLKSLVKIYETMKPKDAARIFMALEMPVLLDVIERMKENKVAPIMADLDPERAKAITTEIAERRQFDGKDDADAPIPVATRADPRGPLPSSDPRGVARDGQVSDAGAAPASAP